MARPETDKNDINPPVDDIDVEAMVEKMMNEVKTKFDDMSNQILGKIDEMSAKIQTLEKSMEEIIDQADDALGDDK